MAELAFIRPDWPAPPTVRAVATTRAGGSSSGAWAGLNLGDHVDDDPAAVAANRACLEAALDLPAPPRWLRQVHGIAVTIPGRREPAESDAAVTREAGRVLAILTADCLPVLFAHRDGRVIGAAHAGWRGLAAGVLEATLAAMDCRPADVMAWLGPAIGPAAFEVGDEVRTAFLDADPGAGAAFVANARGRWQADLAALARRRLGAAGVTAVYGGELCTLADPSRFYSHRRDGRTGRMASLIWIESRAGRGAAP